MAKPKVYIVKRDGEIIFIKSNLKSRAVEEFLRSVSVVSCILLGTADGPEGQPMAYYLAPGLVYNVMENDSEYARTHEKAIRECCSSWAAWGYSLTVVEYISARLPKRKTKQLEFAL